MAKIGLKSFKYSKLDSNDVVTTPASLGKAITAQVSVTNNTAELYADDALAESDYTFSKATVTLGVDDERDETFADILGHTVSNGEVVKKTSDTAPYVALGRIVTKIVGNTRKYKVEILKKVKFSEPSADESTKGETVEFSSSTIEGTAFALADGTWGCAKTFDTESDAQTYLTAQLTAPVTTTTTPH